MTDTAEEQLRTQVRNAIAACGLKQIWIADKIGISQKHLSQLLTGRVSLTLDWAEKILALCGGARLLLFVTVPPGTSDRTGRIRLDDLNSDQLDQLYDDLDRYGEVLGEMNERVIRAAKELAEAQAAAATPRELELRQRRAWSTAGRCPMCGYDDCGGRLCDDCAATVRRLPSHDRRQWRRYEPITQGAPIQGHGYTPAGLLGAAPDPTETTP